MNVINSFVRYIYSALLPSKNPEYFAQWVYPLCHELVLQSIRFPLVSGFYKLLSLSMVIAKKIRYFQVNPAVAFMVLKSCYIKIVNA